MSKSKVENTKLKDDAAYETARAKGMDHESASAEANKPAGSDNRTQSAGRPPQYDDATVEELHRMATESGITDAAKMERKDILQALKNKNKEENQ